MKRIEAMQPEPKLVGSIGATTTTTTTATKTPIRGNRRKRCPMGQVDDVFERRGAMVGAPPPPPIPQPKRICRSSKQFMHDCIHETYSEEPVVLPRQLFAREDRYSPHGVNNGENSEEEEHRTPSWYLEIMMENNCVDVCDIPEATESEREIAMACLAIEACTMGSSSSSTTSSGDSYSTSWKRTVSRY